MAREFSGNTQYLSHTGSNSSTQILGDVTAMFTVHTDTVAGVAAIVCNQDSQGADLESKNTCWYFGRNGSKWYAFHENGAGVNNGITSAVGLTTAVFYRVCVRRDVSASSYQWTVNGTTYTADTTGYNNSPTGSTATDMFIGSAQAANVQCWNGSIEEVAIYNTLLSQQDAEAYTNGASPLLISPSNLVAYWPIRGTSTERDLVGGQDMTVTSATAFAHSNHAYPPTIWQPPQVPAAAPPAGARPQGPLSHPFTGAFGGPI